MPIETPEPAATPSQAHSRSLGMTAACAVISGLLAFALCFGPDVLSIRAIVDVDERPGATAVLYVDLLGMNLAHQTVLAEAISSRIAIWKWSLASLFFVVGAAAGAMLGWSIGGSPRRNVILLGLIVGLLAGAISQVVIMEISIARDGGNRAGERWEVYAANLLGVVLGAIGGGIAGLFGSLIRNAIGGVVAGGIFGFLLARVVMQFTSGVPGLGRGDLAPLIVIVAGPVVGAVVGSIVSDRLKRR